jgi:hypothetical protein
MQTLRPSCEGPRQTTRTVTAAERFACPYRPAGDLVRIEALPCRSDFLRPSANRAVE